MRTTIAVVEEEVLKYYGMKAEELFVTCKKRHLAERRQIFYYLCRIFTKDSLDTIGAYAGYYRGRLFDHATVLHGENQIINFLGYNKKITADVEAIKKEILKTTPLDVKEESFRINRYNPVHFQKEVKNVLDKMIAKDNELDERLAQIVASHNELLERVELLERMYINALEVV